MNIIPDTLLAKNTNITTWANELSNLFNEFINQINEQLNIPHDDLWLIWKKIGIDEPHNNIINKANKSYNTETPRFCIMELRSGPRKGEECGKKITGTSNNIYCTIHAKKNKSNSPVTSNVMDETNNLGLIFKKNRWGRYQFGSTGLVLSDSNDKRIIGKQLENGLIADLTDDDIMLCKRRKLKYVSNYNFTQSSSSE